MPLITRRTSAAITAMAAVSVISLAGCSASPSAGTVTDWSTVPTAEHIAEQAGNITTYGLPDSWANYGALLAAFCEENNAECDHTDTDMGSSEEMQRFDAEKGNPIGLFGDIGGLWGPVAETLGVTSGYVPAATADLKSGQYSETGGWVNTFTGVMGFLVNPAVVDVPQTWEDLLNDEYADGKIASLGANALTGGSGQAAALSIALARGGDISQTDAAWEYLNELYASQSFSDVPPSLESLIRGEFGVYLQYDFNAIAAIEDAAEQGIELEFVVPQDGSLHMPSSLLTNGYNTDRADFIKGFMDFVLTDEGQLLFADFGARPIRYVNGDLEVPEDRRTRWLPEEQYENTQSVDVSVIDPEQLITEYEAQVTAQ